VVTLPAEFVGVLVEVDTTTIVVGVAVVGGVMVDDSVTTGGVLTDSEEDGVGVGVEGLSSLDGVGVGVVISLSLLETPVDKLTLCRLNSAMASSKGSADTAVAQRSPARRTLILCIVKTE
jgi:hypothetical protein